MRYEYPGLVMSYEGVLLNGHGLGGGTSDMRYYHAHVALRKPWDLI